LFHLSVHHFPEFPFFEVDLVLKIAENPFHYLKKRKKENFLLARQSSKSPIYRPILTEMLLYAQN